MLTWVVTQMDGNKGKVMYDEERKLAIVEMPDPAVDRAMEAYFRSNQKFWIPESQQIDDYREESLPPITDVNYMGLSMVGILKFIPGIRSVVFEPGGGYAYRGLSPERS